MFVYNDFFIVFWLRTRSTRCVILVSDKEMFLFSCQINQKTKVIYDDAFSDCTSLTSVIIGDGVISIGRGAFYKCTSLTSTNIPKSVTSIGSDAFYNCDSLTSVYISDIASWCGIEFGNSYANPLCCGANLYLNENIVTELVI